MVILHSSITDWIGHLLACMGDEVVEGEQDGLCLPFGISEPMSSGCFGCCSKSTPIIAVDEPSKGLKIQGRTVKRPSISDDFWSTSTCDLENSAVQSQISISSISTSNQTLNHIIGPSGTSSHSDFVNHGLLLWNQGRHQWIENSKTKNRSKHSWAKSSWPGTYESLLGTKNPFPRPIPLSEMVDFLVDVWEHEGLYD